METKRMINQLKRVANKHMNDTLRTFDTNITALCRDVVPKLEVLARYEETGLIPEEIMDGKMLTGWIPVTERLPEVGIYLVTCDDEKYPVKVMRFKESEDTILWYTSRGIYDGRIYAWMPLPEPCHT